MALRVTIRSISYRAEGIHSFRLMSAAGESLPSFTAGSHIDLYLKNGMVRSYSLHNCPGSSDYYEIAVQNEPQGRGGSKFVHENFRVGETIEISEPRNHFPLVEGSTHSILIAGGIGITPILAMAHWLTKTGSPFSLFYLVRSETRLAFLEEVNVFSKSANVTVEIEEERGRPDLVGLIGSPVAGDHVYCCGPTGLLAAVRVATRDWPPEAIHFESFTSTPEVVSGQPQGHIEFEIELNSTGQVLPVFQGQTMLAALRANGISVESSCEAGTCGTCKTRVLAGEPDHQDFVLTDDEQQAFVMPCVSRSKSKRLKLDL